MTRSLRVALIFGGRSGEHEVSVVSARSIARALADGCHQVIPMAIDHNGRWADADTARRVLETSGDRPDRVAAFDGRDRIDPRLLNESFDVAFPVLHGPFGEDGTVQGLFELLDLPYVGSGVTASAVCMDKIISKRLLQQGGFATAAWVELDARQWRDNRTRHRELCLKLGLPVFVKPSCLGSSVGISKVSSAGDLDAAVDTALGHDQRVIVERGLKGRELEVAVLGNHQARAALPGEVVPGHEFYDYADKYLDDHCQLLSPAPLDARHSAAAQELAIRVYHHLNCSGMARVDLFFDEAAGDLWVNEVNTIPGFTSISMYPRLWEVSGLTYPELVEELIRLALERAAEGESDS